MKQISNEEYDELMAFMKERILNLWTHENACRNSNDKLDSTQVGFPISNIIPYNVDADRRFYLVFNNVFLNLITNQLPKAQNDYPQNFGTNNAIDVIEALYNVNGFSSDWFSIDQYKQLLSNKPCYVVYKNNGTFENDILRIDLYRYIRPNLAGGFDFVGGLLHALKHYSMGGVNLSTGNDVNDVFDILHVVYMTAMAFRNKSGNESRFTSDQDLYNKPHVLRYEFYKEEESGIFFLNTSHLE